MGITERETWLGISQKRTSRMEQKLSWRGFAGQIKKIGVALSLQVSTALTGWLQCVL